MRYTQERKDQVRAAYVSDRLDMKALSEKFDIPYITIRTWKKKAAENGDDWDTARSAAVFVGSGMQVQAARFMEDFVRLYQRTVKDLNARLDNPDIVVDPIETANALAKMADSFAKSSKAVMNSAPTYSKLATGHEVIEEFTQYLRDHHKDKMRDWVKILPGFARRLAEVFAE